MLPHVGFLNVKMCDFQTESMCSKPRLSKGATQCINKYVGQPGGRIAWHHGVHSAGCHYQQLQVQRMVQGAHMRGCRAMRNDSVAMPTLPTWVCGGQNGQARWCNSTAYLTFLSRSCARNESCASKECSTPRWCRATALSRHGPPHNWLGVASRSLAAASARMKGRTREGRKQGLETFSETILALFAHVYNDTSPNTHTDGDGKCGVLPPLLN